MSRYLDLLKQVPPGKEEIPEKLLKKLDIAACNLITSHGGLYELSEEERREFDSDRLLEVEWRLQKWGLLDRFPLEAGDLVVWQENSREWVLGVRLGSNPPIWLDVGSKEYIFELGRSIIDIREKEGQDAYEEEIMYQRSVFLGEPYDD